MLPIAMSKNSKKTVKMFTHLIIIGMIALSSHSAGVNIWYNINGGESDFVAKSEFKGVFTSTISIRPYRDVRIDKVVEDDIVLWESKKDDEMCDYIVIFRFEELVTLVCIKIKSPRRNYQFHFMKREGMWELLEARYFTEILNDIKTKIPTDKHILLNIQNPDEERVTVSRWNTGGADFTTYTTNYPYKTIKIVDGSSLVWRGNYNDDCCIDCAVYLKNENFELLQAFLCADDKAGFKFFTKLENNWKSLEQDEFYNNLKELDIAENDRIYRECRDRMCKS